MYHRKLKTLLPGARSVNKQVGEFRFLLYMMSETAEASFDDVQMSRDGMRLLLCNDWKAAEDLFDKYKYVLIIIFLKDVRTLIGAVVDRNRFKNANVLDHLLIFSVRIRNN